MQRKRMRKRAAAALLWLTLSQASNLVLSRTADLLLKLGVGLPRLRRPCGEQRGGRRSARMHGACPADRRSRRAETGALAHAHHRRSGSWQQVVVLRRRPAVVIVQVLGARVGAIELKVRRPGRVVLLDRGQVHRHDWTGTI
jgi:hypothetical protein